VTVYNIRYDFGVGDHSTLDVLQESISGQLEDS